MNKHELTSVADPGFPVGGCVYLLGGCGPLARVLFGENVCENDRIGSHRGGVRPARPPPRSANEHGCHLDPLGVAIVVRTGLLHGRDLCPEVPSLVI